MKRLLTATEKAKRRADAKAYRQRKAQRELSEKLAEIGLAFGTEAPPRHTAPEDEATAAALGIAIPSLEGGRFLQHLRGGL